MKSPEAIDVVREYAAKQAALCRALLQQHSIRDTVRLLDLPRHGNVGLDETFWEFQRHGVGVCFSRVPSGEIVDVPTGVADAPDAFDAWRLIEYLESRGIDELRHRGQAYRVTEGQALKLLLRRLAKDGVLTPIDNSHKLYLVCRA